MSKAIKLGASTSLVLASAAPAAAADAVHGKDIATRWCASCHLVDKGQTSATDQAPPFSYLARTPDFDQNKLAFLLLCPTPTCRRSRSIGRRSRTSPTTSAP